MEHEVPTVVTKKSSMFWDITLYTQSHEIQMTFQRNISLPSKAGRVSQRTKHEAHLSTWKFPFLLRAKEFIQDHSREGDTESS
jgi:hypothetical protein